MSLLGENGPDGEKRNGIKSPVMCSRYWMSFLYFHAAQRRAALAGVIKSARRVLRLPSRFAFRVGAAATLFLQTPHVWRLTGGPLMPDSALIFAAIIAYLL